MTGVSTSCGACKFLRRKCTIECIYAPYFSYDEAVAHFAAVHKVFGASNVSRLLLHLPEQFRGEAALTISFEAIARVTDPVHGCVAYIYALQREVANLQEEIEVLGKHVVNSMSIGIPRDCGRSLETKDDLLIYGSLPLLHSHEDEMINLPEFWNSSVNNQVEPVTVPTHAENESCSIQMTTVTNHMMNLPVSFCEWEGQNLFGITETGNGAHPQECLVEGLLNPETFYYSSLFGWLPSTPSPV